MSMRRVTAAVSVVLLVLLSVAVAEAAVLTLVVLFSFILRLGLALRAGDQVLQLWLAGAAEPSITVFQGGIVASILFTFACGAGAAVWRYRRWRPA